MSEIVEPDEKAAIIAVMNKSLTQVRQALSTGREESLVFACRRPERGWRRPWGLRISSDIVRRQFGLPRGMYSRQGAKRPSDRLHRKEFR